MPEYKILHVGRLDEGVHKPAAALELRIWKKKKIMSNPILEQYAFS